jgi:hypothetical protein
MNALTAALRDHAGVVLLALSLATLVLGVAVVGLAVRLRRLRRWMGQVLQGAKGENLERMLYEHLKSRVVVEEGMEAARRRLDALERRVDTAKRFVGVVRFDAFPDIGGQQSFALAVYDDLGNGAVVSNLVGRSDARVYCKRLRQGSSDIELSVEERRAIEVARARGAVDA